DLQLRAAGLSLAPQPDLLARRRIPRGRTGRVRLRGFHALRERQGDAALLRDARGGCPTDGLVRETLVAAEARRAADPRTAHRRRRARELAREQTRRRRTAAPAGRHVAPPMV